MWWFASFSYPSVLAFEFVISNYARGDGEKSSIYTENIAVLSNWENLYANEPIWNLPTISIQIHFHRADWSCQRNEWMLRWFIQMKTYDGSNGIFQKHLFDMLIYFHSVFPSFKCHHSVRNCFCLKIVWQQLKLFGYSWATTCDSLTSTVWPIIIMLPNIFDRH